MLYQINQIAECAWKFPLVCSSTKFLIYFVAQITNVVNTNAFQYSIRPQFISANVKQGNNNLPYSCLNIYFGIGIPTSRFGCTFCRLRHFGEKIRPKNHVICFEQLYR